MGPATLFIGDTTFKKTEQHLAKCPAEKGLHVTTIPSVEQKNNTLSKWRVSECAGIITARSVFCPRTAQEGKSHNVSWGFRLLLNISIIDTRSVLKAVYWNPKKVACEIWRISCHLYSEHQDKPISYPANTKWVKLHGQFVALFSLAVINFTSKHFTVFVEWYRFK